ncbi:MAG TPA: tetratricopeptide repeat protein, partial [Kofleriaceae bacterium]|nr:tetratricopeptide repeat protein [Kofleriaceae bacterium]
WANPRALWTRAVESNPDDADAWSFYAEALASDGEPAEALAVTRQGLTHVDTPRLRLREAILVMQLGDRAGAIPLFRRAATGGDPRAMADLALLEADDPATLADALEWARRGALVAVTSAHAHRTHGKLALATGNRGEALDAFTRAYALEPASLQNRFNLGLVLTQLGRRAEAAPHLQACLGDPALADRAAELLRGS